MKHLYLHSFGSNRNEGGYVRNTLNLSSEDFFALDAPFRTINKGFAWYLVIKNNRVQEKMLAQSLKYLNNVIQCFFRNDNLTVWGFSQGGSMAVALALKHPQIKAAVCMGGYIPDSTNVPVTKDSIKDKHFVLVHGINDTVNDFYLRNWALESLLGVNAKVSTFDHARGHLPAPASQLKEVFSLLNKE